MSKRKKIILFIIAVLVIGGFWFVIGPPCMMIGFMAYQQRKGCSYLDSITEKDIPAGSKEPKSIYVSTTLIRTTSAA